MPDWTETSPLRVVTGYHNIARKFFREHKFEHVVLLNADGALEAAPLMGSADIILDLVSTGEPQAVTLYTCTCYYLCCGLSSAAPCCADNRSLKSASGGSPPRTCRCNPDRLLQVLPALMLTDVLPCRSDFAGEQPEAAGGRPDHEERGSPGGQQAARWRPGPACWRSCTSS